MAKFLERGHRLSKHCFDTMLRPSNTSTQTSTQSPSNSVKTLERSGEAFMVQCPSTPSEQTPCCRGAREIVETAQSRFHSVFRSNNKVNKSIHLQYTSTQTRWRKATPTHWPATSVYTYIWLVTLDKESLLLDNTNNQYLVIAVI